MGDDGHGFWLRGGGTTVKSRVLGVGGTARLTTTLKKGVRYSYRYAMGEHAGEATRGSFVAR
jgi:hypothetical protein